MPNPRGRALWRAVAWTGLAASVVAVAARPGAGDDGRRSRQLDPDQTFAMFQRAVLGQVRAASDALGIPVDERRAAVGLSGGGAAVAPVTRLRWTKSGNTANDDWETPVAVVVVGSGQRSRLASGFYGLKLRPGPRRQLLFDLIDQQAKVVHTGTCSGNTARILQAARDQSELVIRLTLSLTAHLPDRDHYFEFTITITVPEEGDGGDEGDGSEDGGGESRGDGGCTVPLPI